MVEYELPLLLILMKELSLIAMAEVPVVIFAVLVELPSPMVMPLLV